MFHLREVYPVMFGVWWCALVGDMVMLGLAVGLLVKERWSKR
jgi:hypothetical protein